MSETVTPVAEWAAAVVEMIGVGLIVLLVVYSLGYAVVQLIRRVDSASVYRDMRHRAARGILLGLEVLIGADIIHTVAVELNFETIGVLSVIVLIRTFLSFTLEVELTGHWPWQHHQGDTGI